MFRPSVIVSTIRRPDSEARAVMAASSAFQIGVPPAGHSSLPMTRLSTALSPVRCGLIAISSPKLPICARSCGRSASTNDSVDVRSRMNRLNMLPLMSSMMTTVIG